MNKYIIAAIIIAAVIVGFAVLGGDNVSSEISKEVNSPLTLSPENYDFGEIDIFGGKVETDFLVQNNGDQDVVILNAYTSCMCTEGEIDGFRFGMHGTSGEKATIPAGESKVVTAIFDPLAHGPEGTGPITRELILETNSTITPELTARFGGNVVKNQ